MYRLREERQIEPKVLAQLVSSTLYEKRCALNVYLLSIYTKHLQNMTRFFSNCRFGPYFTYPVIAGLNSKTSEPFICGFDSIGCIDFAKDFIVSGTAADQLFGMCESLWEPDLEPEDLFETVSQALLNAQDRDALSGWGAKVVIITKDKITTRLLKSRQD